MTFPQPVGASTAVFMSREEPEAVRRSDMVLLLDDDETFRHALAANLSDDGYRVCEFARPADVPPLPLPEAITMLIVDFEMGGENGLAFADRFHVSHPDVPVVMLTAYWSDYLDREIGARDFITLRRKPVDYDELARLLPPHG
jgi:DNA-binding NtrC family response regulator